MPATITSIAHYLPEMVYDNEYFSKYLDTTDEWIMARTGIKERRIMANGATSDMIVPAARQALANKNYTVDDIDCIVVASVTPDYMYPNTAAMVQHKLGMKEVWGFDLSAACSGFLFALITASKLVESGAAKRLMLCGADKMSAIVDYQDRATCVLFGDAASVCILEKTDDPNSGLIDFIARIDGEGGQYLQQPAGGSFMPASAETVAARKHFVYQDGKAVFKAAVKGMADVSVEIMERNNLSSDDIAWLVPHQANLRIISATAERMGLDPSKVMINIEKYGNTTAATIPLCLSEWLQDGKLKNGDKLVLSTFGAGFTWGSVLFNWNMDI